MAVVSTVMDVWAVPTKATAQAINSAVVIRIGWVFINFSSFFRLSCLRFGTNLRTLFVLSQ